MFMTVRRKTEILETLSRKIDMLSEQMAIIITDIDNIKKEISKLKQEINDIKYFRGELEISLPNISEIKERIEEIERDTEEKYKKFVEIAKKYYHIMKETGKTYTRMGFTIAPFSKYYGIARKFDVFRNREEGWYVMHLQSRKLYDLDQPEDMPLAKLYSQLIKAVSNIKVTKDILEEYADLINTIKN